MTRKKNAQRPLDTYIDIISQCDVILRCKDELFIGLYFNIELEDSPIVIYKSARPFNYYLTKVAEKIGVTCVDNQLLAKSLFEEVEEGKVIPSKYIRLVALIYSKLRNFKITKDRLNIYEKLNNDAISIIDALEKYNYRFLERKFIKNKKIRSKLFEEDVVNLFSELQILVERNKLNYKKYHNKTYETDEYYLGTNLEKYGVELWQVIFVCKKDKKIYIGSKSFFKQFDFSEIYTALEFVKDYVDSWTERLGPNVTKFCEEFEKFLPDFLLNIITILYLLHSFQEQHFFLCIQI